MFDQSLVSRLCSSLMGRGVPARDVDDVLQQARLEVWRCLQGETRDKAELEAFLCSVAKLRAIDRWRSERHTALREDYEELAEAHEAPATLQMREAIAAIERDLADEPQLAHALVDLAEKEVAGEDYEAIGRARGEPAARVRRGVFELRAYAQRRLGDYKALVALAVVAVIVSMLRSARHGEATDPGPQPKLVPTIAAPPKGVPQETPAEKAKALRTHAGEACGQGHYVECLRALNAAKVVDGVGEGSEEVRALREMAEHGLEGYTSSGKPRGR